MPTIHEIRADYDATSIVVYQAYPKPIAEAALRAGTFTPPFSFGRMTWIKPSFLWMMERSNWGQKAGQEHVLAVRITRKGWEQALALAVLTHPDKGVHRDEEDWRRQFEQANAEPLDLDVAERWYAGVGLPARSKGRRVVERR